MGSVQELEPECKPNKTGHYFGATPYDSAYMALAQAEGVWFFTGDKRLFNAVGQTLSWVKWLGDYQFDAIPAPETAMP